MPTDERQQTERDTQELRREVLQRTDQQLLSINKVLLCHNYTMNSSTLKFINQLPTHWLKKKYGETWRFHVRAPFSAVNEDVAQRSDSKEHKATNHGPRQDKQQQG